MLLRLGPPSVAKPPSRDLRACCVRKLSAHLHATQDLGSLHKLRSCVGDSRQRKADHGLCHSRFAAEHLLTCPDAAVSPACQRRSGRAGAVCCLVRSPAAKQRLTRCTWLAGLRRLWPAAMPCLRAQAEVVSLLSAGSVLRAKTSHTHLRPQRPAVSARCTSSSELGDRGRAGKAAGG